MKPSSVFNKKPESSADKIAALIAQFPTVSTLEGVAIAWSGRDVYLTDNNTVLKVARTNGSIEQGLLELDIWVHSTDEDKLILCPIVGATWTRKILVTEMPYAPITNLTEEQAKQTQLYSLIQEEYDEQLIGLSMTRVTDISADDDDGCFSNFGILEDGRGVIIDYGDAEYFGTNWSDVVGDLELEEPDEEYLDDVLNSMNGHYSMKIV
jgi:hypothetical protein